MSKAKQIQAPKGMNDILPSEQPYWDFIYTKAKDILGAYSFEKIDTPIVESTALFTSSVGRGTDIVDKEMYTFKTKGGDELTIRPEMTAPAARAYIEHGMQVMPHPVQLWYFAPVMRHDNPQFGRYRQFTQLGVEMYGDESPAADAALIFIAYTFLESLGLKDIVVHVNSIGDANCRPQYIKALKDYYKTNSKKACAQCKERIKTNPLRVLDCKEASCIELKKDAPQLLDYLDEECKRHFKLVMEFLDQTGVNYRLDPHLVRGLDYYSRTVFEIWPEEKAGENNLQLAILSGGRYDGLIQLLGGPKTAASGWGSSLERVVLLMKEQAIEVPDMKPAPQVFIAQLGELAKRKTLLLFERFRQAGITAKASFGRDNIKSQLRIANRYGINYTLIMGQKEALEDSVIIREMDSGVQETVPWEKVVDLVKKRLGIK